MAINFFGKVTNEYRGTSDKIKEDGVRLQTFEYKCETKSKKYSVSGVIETKHADKRIEKIYDNLRKTINTGGRVKPIDLQRAIEKALHSDADLKRKEITIIKKK